VEITSIGDSALLIRIHDHFEKDPEAALEAVADAQQRLLAAAIPAVIESAPAYDSIGLFYDPARAVEAGAPPEDIVSWLKEKLDSVFAGSFVPKRDGKSWQLIEIPVCYEAFYAPDLDEVARRSRLSADKVVRLHNSVEYRVHCIGFVPGFPYLGGLPKQLASPRRDVPRKVVPAGSVAIGGAQAGIYPIATPGGWNLIGRTPVTLFDPQREPPVLLAPGDRVRFRSISRVEFEAWAG
jgi:inhibitor of KinA